MTHTGNKNDMSTWGTIACQRGHETHKSRRVIVQLDGPTPYHDFAPIPHKFARDFVIDIYPPELYLVDGGPYCPAHDAVSETIASHGVWEPRETVLALTVCESAPEDSYFVDFGAQIGWFSLVAASCGITALAVDADAENLRLLNASAEANGWGQRVIDGHAHRDHIELWRERVGPDTPAWGDQFPVRLAKIDVEGAEDEAVRVLWPSIEAGLVDFMLIEISPVFATYYPDLVQRIVDAGYRAYLLPPKHQPPVTLEDPEHDLAPYRIDDRADLRALVASWHQENVVFQRAGASW